MDVEAELRRQKRLNAMLKAIAKRLMGELRIAKRQRDNLERWFTRSARELEDMKSKKEGSA